MTTLVPPNEWKFGFTGASSPVKNTAAPTLPIAAVNSAVAPAAAAFIQSSDGRTDEAKAREHVDPVGGGEPRRHPYDCLPRDSMQAGVGSERSSPSEAIPQSVAPAPTTDADALGESQPLESASAEIQVSPGELRASHNSGEREPSVMPAWAPGESSSDAPELSGDDSLISGPDRSNDREMAPGASEATGVLVRPIYGAVRLDYHVILRALERSIQEDWIFGIDEPVPPAFLRRHA